MSEFGHYFVLEICHHSGGASPYVYLDESRAKAAIKTFTDQAWQAKKWMEDRSLTALVKTTETSVEFEWSESPVGMVRWSAKLHRIGSSDHLFQPKGT